MMHQNKLISKLYRLKRKLFDGNLQYISYSIPLACIMILLFGLIYGIVLIDSSFVLDDNEVYAESVTSTNSNASLTITENDLHTTAAPGSVAYASTNVSYSTTNVENYTLKISYAENYNALVGDSADASVISNITNNALSDNSWGYAWSDNTSLSDNDFDGLTYSSMPSYNSGNNLASGSTNVSNGTGKLVFAAKFANNAVTTNYKTSVLLALATTPKANLFTVNYNLNGGTSRYITDYSATSIDSTQPYYITSSLPTRDGYDFLGWSTIDYSENTATAVASTSYLPGKLITLRANSTVKLYAVWRTQVAMSPGFSTITYMHEMTNDICNSAVKGATKSLIDIRDGSAYTVTKLADNRCWMTQNLRLAGGTTLTSAYSNVGDSEEDGANYTLPESVPVTNGVTGNDSKSVFVSPDPNIGQMRNATNDNYGAYYSYNAATASTMVNRGGTTAYDICPKGWRLPYDEKVGGDGDFAMLFKALGYSGNGNKAAVQVLLNSPNNFVIAGYVQSSGLVSVGIRTYYTVSYGDTGSSLGVFSMLIRKGDSGLDVDQGFIMSFGNRSTGRPVRCVAK